MLDFMLQLDKEEKLVRLRESQRQQAQQAESALENFKKQVELSAQKTYADMKQQMEKVEADLIRSKSLREKQFREFSYQLEELQQRYEQQIVELKLQHEQERTHLLQTHNAEKDSLVQDHQWEIGSLEKQTRAAMVQQQTQTQELRKRDAQVGGSLPFRCFLSPFCFGIMIMLPFVLFITFCCEFGYPAEKLFLAVPCDGTGHSVYGSILLHPWLPAMVPPAEGSRQRVPFTVDGSRLCPKANGDEELSVPPDAYLLQHHHSWSSLFHAAQPLQHRDQPRQRGLSD
ncbi:centrosomal protein of 112 kDa-like, partial [Triplophysa rosa]|uniref:centrosomal protein of 112 kDa-like n=1 Tax=Triplophysa rosa TaxID=992332 RepID=UPI002545D1CF